MIVTALCTACFSRAKINKKNFGLTLNALAPALLIQECFKRHIMLLQTTVYWFLKAHFFSFFRHVKGRCCNWSSAPEF